MAIVKMKKLRLVSVKSQREELLKRLMLLGCVEISQPDKLLEDEETAALLSRESVGVSQLQRQYDTLKEALVVLDKFASVKSSLLTPKPETSVHAVMNDKTLEKTLEVAKTINVTDDKIKRIELEQEHLRGLIESLEPWKSLDLPLELSETETCFAMPGVVPAAAELKALETELYAAAEHSQLISASDDKEMHYILLIAMKSDWVKLMEILRKYSFAKSSVSEQQGTAAENIRKHNRQLAERGKKKEELIKRISTFSHERAEIQLCADRMLTKLGQAENGEKLLSTEKTVVFEGWFPAEKESALGEALAKFDCAWEAVDPAPDEYTHVPVKLKNNRFTRPLNMVTNMYSLPAYSNVDPNPLMAPFFILFYGMMMADMGYGILMILISALVLKKKKPSGETRNLLELMLEAGVSTIIFGALTGSFFGDAPLQIARVINPETTFKGLPYLFSPLDNTLEILIGAMALGFIQIITGMIISFVRKTKAGHLADAIMDEGSWWLVFIGIGVGAVTGFWYVAIAGVLALICTQGRDKPTIIGKIIGGVASLYDITAYFGDILSYSRLMALMLAGSVISQVFNTLGAIPGNLVFFFIVFVIGHALNIGLNLLGCYVHDLRLQCLEYFGKFYEDGGRAFDPLSVKTEYYNIVK